MLAAPTPSSLLPYALLYLGVLSLVLPSTIRAWPWLLGASLLAGLATGTLAPAALIPLMALAMACFGLGWDRPRLGRIGRWVGSSPSSC